MRRKEVNSKLNLPPTSIKVEKPTSCPPPRKQKQRRPSYESSTQEEREMIRREELLEVR